jgi:spiro-SPASM protein
MKTLCVLLNRPVVQPDRPLRGRTVADWISAALDQALPGGERVVLEPVATPSAFVDALVAATRGFDEAVLVWSDAPFIRPDLIGALLDLHHEYRADYTFADGFPTGLAPEILRPSILPVLAEWAKDKTAEVDRGTLFELLSTDINRFDVETYLSPVDLRSRRLSLTADSLRNRLLLDRYADEAGLELNAFVEALERTGERARTLPATLHVQITDGNLQVPVWSPVKTFLPDTLTSRNTLTRAQWNDLLDRALAWAGDLTVLPSFWGEPSLHPDILKFLTDALAKPGLRICLETSGLGWSPIDVESLTTAANGRLDWVVELDSDVEATYKTLRGEGFGEAHEFVERLLPLFPGHVWPQTVRMDLNEGEMEAFYKRWKTEAGRVIIQKHNDFGGRLARAKPSDLSPWKRHACWHLARDLAVFLDGSVVVCRDDFDRTMPLGNAFTESWETIWDRGAALFGRHLKEDWPEVCRNCDEWYTFHF